MPICSIQGRDFRRFSRFELVCDPHINWLIGPNGSGKTSILEGIYLLSRGKSFRTVRRQSIWRHGAHGFTLKARITDPLRGYAHLTADATTEAISFRIQSEPVRSMSLLAGLLPVQLMDPRITPLVSGGPSDRRRFLDWGLFHVEPSFRVHWRDYARALEQRNAALRMSAPDDVLAGWERALVREGEAITSLRNAHLAELGPYLTERAMALDCPAQMTLRYQPGYPAGQTFRDALIKSRGRDRLRSITSVGPHRADVEIRIAHYAAQQVLSRGEEKRYSYALLLAQVDVFHRHTGDFPIILMDDPAAELDRLHWQRLSGILSSLPAQQFIAALENASPPVDSPVVFHVEQFAATGMV
jgi:DNA replication and repair protein RecF